MDVHSSVAVYDSYENAEAAVGRLQEADFPMDQLSLITKSATASDKLQELITSGDQSEPSAKRGASIGGVLGALMAASLIWIPGFGQVVAAGPLAAAIAVTFGAAATGGIVGALVGVMAGWGIPQHQIEHYKDLVRQQKILLIAHGSPDEVALAHKILAETDPEEHKMHAPSSADSPEIAKEA